MTLALTRSDTLPENTNYPDTGCDRAPSCIACPLALCKHDDPTYYGRANRRRRNQDIFDERMAGAQVQDLAKKYSISTRSIHRAVQFTRDGLYSDEELPGSTVTDLEDLARYQVKSLFRERDPWPELKA